MLVLLSAMGIAAAARPQPGRNRGEAVKAPASPARKGAPKLLSTPNDATETPVYRYGQLSRAACEAELRTRNIPFKRETARGVMAPVRLTGPLHGVVFRTELPEKERRTTPHEIADCRLVLALDDYSEILSKHDIVEVRHYSIYRPPVGPGSRQTQSLHHLAAVAIDAGRFVKKDGKVLDVDKHFHGAIGARTCGAGARPRPATAEALELRAILCEGVARRVFNVVLTPNYNAPHKNHFHLEVTPAVKWFLIN